jgi:hypothetical protein
MLQALAIGGTIAVSFAVESGLGKRRSLLNPQDILNIERDMYITTLLYILTLGASKLSVTIFLGRLACTSINKAAVILLGVLVVCGAVSLAAAKAFECELPRPWDYSGKCIRVVRVLQSEKGTLARLTIVATILDGSNCNRHRYRHNHDTPPYPHSFRSAAPTSKEGYRYVHFHTPHPVSIFPSLFQPHTRPKLS